MKTDLESKPAAMMPDAAAAVSLVTNAEPDRTHKRPRPSKQNPAGWPWLSPKELDERLKLGSAELVEEIHALSLRLLAGEDQRESRIDAKAQGLLVTAGLSLTAASTFGGVLLQHPEYLASVGSYGTQVVIAAYGVGLLAGLSASFLAVLALFVKNTFRAVDEREALAHDALAIADAEQGAAARTAYRRYMTLHYWRLWQRNFGVLERKARTIKWGQICFIVFLFILMAVGVVMAYASHDRYLSQ